MAIEAIVRQKDKEITAASIAKLSGKFTKFVLNTFSMQQRYSTECFTEFLTWLNLAMLVWSNQFSTLPQLPQKMMTTSNAVKRDSKIINSLC